MAGWWWRRRRHSACGAGGGGVNEAAALCWRRWRRRHERGVSVCGDGDHYGSDGGGREGGGGKGRLAEWQYAENARHDGGWTVSVVPLGVRNCVPALPGHILASFGKAPMRMLLGNPLATHVRPGLCAASRIPVGSQFCNFAFREPPHTRHALTPALCGLSSVVQYIHIHTYVTVGRPTETSSYGMYLSVYLSISDAIGPIAATCAPLAVCSIWNL